MSKFVEVKVTTTKVILVEMDDNTLDEDIVDNAIDVVFDECGTFDEASGVLVSEGEVDSAKRHADEFLSL